MRAVTLSSVKPEPLLYGERRVYTVSAFNVGVASWIDRLPTLWVEGEITELRRQERRPSVYWTLKDPEDGSSLPVSMRRVAFDRLERVPEEGERVHVHGRAQLWAARASFALRAEAIEPVGLGAVLLRLEQLRRKLAAEGLFAPERKRPLPKLPRRIAVVTGNEAAAKRDVITTMTSRFPPARILVVETYVQGPRAPLAIVSALRAACEADVDVIVLTRGGGSFDDLLPFSDERLVRAIAACPVPVVSAVGHEQDVPLCDLVADARASTPTAAARLVVPDWRELIGSLEALRASLERGTSRRVGRAREALELDRIRLVRAPELLLERTRARLAADRERLSRVPTLLAERRRGRVEALGGRLSALSPRSTLDRGYAIVRRRGTIVKEASVLISGDSVDVELAIGGFGARVEETRE